MGLDNVNDTKRSRQYMGCWNLKIGSSHTLLSYYVSGDILDT